VRDSRPDPYDRDLVEAHFFFSLMELKFELLDLCLQSKHSTALAMPPVHFVLVILEIKSHKLLAWAGLKRISVTQIARITGVSNRCPA
jgi:hypothetical protein